MSGIAIDLDSGTIFPAEFPWNNFEDFSEQLKDRVSRRTGHGGSLSDEDRCKTKLSTFKPKPQSHALGFTSSTAFSRPVLVTASLVKSLWQTW